MLEKSPKERLIITGQYGSDISFLTPLIVIMSKSFWYYNSFECVIWLAEVEINESGSF